MEVFLGGSVGGGGGGGGGGWVTWRNCNKGIQIINETIWQLR